MMGDSWFYFSSGVVFENGRLELGFREVYGCRNRELRLNPRFLDYSYYFRMSCRLKSIAFTATGCCCFLTNVLAITSNLISLLIIVSEDKSFRPVDFCF